MRRSEEEWRVRGGEDMGCVGRGVEVRLINLLSYKAGRGPPGWPTL